MFSFEKELKNKLAQKSSGITSEEQVLKKSFKYFDLNGNGTVEQAEMQARLGGQRMIKFLDKNKDGMISRKELDASNE